MRASRYARAGGALGHLLLVVMLALGVFAMHGMGHPRDASGHASGHTPGPVSGSAMRAASHAAATGTGDTAAPADTAAAVAHEPMDAPAFVVTGEHAAEPADSPATHQPAMGTDMLSLCVAVLFGAWVLAALLKSAFARHREQPAGLLAHMAAVLRSGPPPRGPDLACLSVLRL